MLTLLLIKKLYPVLIPLTLLINVILLIFLLFGSTSTSGIYSDTYLVKYSFNTSSPIFEQIKHAYASSNTTIDVSKLEVTASYLGICASSGKHDKTCVSRTKTSNLSAFQGLQIYSDNSTSLTASLDLVAMASKFSNKIVHPYVLMVTIVFSFILFLSTIILLLLSFFSAKLKLVLTKLSLVLSFVLVLLWGIGAFWSHVAIDTSNNLMSLSSLSVINSYKGTQSQAMSWSAFTFFLIDFLGIMVLFIKNIKEKTKMEEDDSFEKSFDKQTPQFYSN